MRMEWYSRAAKLLLPLYQQYSITRHGLPRPATAVILQLMSTNVSQGHYKGVQKMTAQLSKCPASTSAWNPLLTITRLYAKAKDKKKSDKGKKKTVEVNEEVLSEVINVESLKNQMQKAVDGMKEDFLRNLSIRSAVGSIETIPVTFDGKKFMLQELAQVGRKNPKTVIISMNSFPQAIPAVLTAIQKSGMNLNPQQDGTTLFIPVPKVTKEHREGLAKNAKALFVKYRDSVKDIQNKYVKQVKRNNSISEDLSHEVQDQIVSIGHQYISEMDKILEAKQVELIGKQ